MNISEVDLKILWGKAAGRCSCPGCSNICISCFEKSGEKVIGEMSHVIAQSGKGPRGTDGVKGPDTYDNLILLCPYHHEMVDKAPADFPSELLHQWKRQHELRVEQSLEGAQFTDTKSLFLFAEKILIENSAIHQKYGPESAAATANPLSEGAILWSLRKCDTVLPNNRKIINAFTRNHDCLSADQWKNLADSFPASLRSEWEHFAEIEDDREQRKQIEAYLDRGRSECHLWRPEIAKLVEENFRQFSGEGCGSQSRAPRCELRAWVIMPNHVHILFKMGTVSMAEIVGGWKKHAGRLANKLLGERGAFWAEDYFDTYMRDAEHVRKTVRYIENNPTKAKLVLDPKDWPWSSARFRDEFGVLRL